MLASEKLMTREDFNALLGELAANESLGGYIGKFDRLREDWEERERYITEEAIAMEGKYNDLVEQYRKRFREGLQGTPMGDGNNISVEEVGGVREYTEEDLYKRED